MGDETGIQGRRLNKRQKKNSTSEKTYNKYRQMSINSFFTGMYICVFWLNLRKTQPDQINTQSN